MVSRRHEYIDEMADMLGGAGLSSERLLQKTGDCQSQASPGVCDDHGAVEPHTTSLWG